MPRAGAACSARRATFSTISAFFSTPGRFGCGAQTVWPPSGRLPFPDSVTAQVEFADGSCGQLIYTAEGDQLWPKEVCTVFGAGLAAEMRISRSSLFIAAAGGACQSFTGKGHAEQMAAWTAFLLGEAEHPLPYEQSRQSMLLTFAVLESIQQGGVSICRSRRKERALAYVRCVPPCVGSYSAITIHVATQLVLAPPGGDESAGDGTARAQEAAAAGRQPRLACWGRNLARMLRRIPPAAERRKTRRRCYGRRCAATSERILSGRWRAFRHLELQVDDPPRWHKDYLVAKISRRPRLRSNSITAICPTARTSSLFGN